MQQNKNFVQRAQDWAEGLPCNSQDIASHLNSMNISENLHQ